MNNEYTHMCHICEKVYPEFKLCEVSLVPDNNILVRFLKNRPALKKWAGLLISVNLVAQSGQKTTNNWQWERDLTICKTCSRSIKKHIIFLSKKENENV